MAAEARGGGAPERKGKGKERKGKGKGKGKGRGRAARGGGERHPDEALRARGKGKGKRPSREGGLGVAQKPSGGLGLPFLSRLETGMLLPGALPRQTHDPRLQLIKGWGGIALGLCGFGGVQRKAARGGLPRRGVSYWLYSTPESFYEKHIPWLPSWQCQQPFLWFFYVLFVVVVCLLL